MLVCITLLMKRLKELVIAIVYINNVYFIGLKYSLLLFRVEAKNL